MNFAPKSLCKKLIELGCKSESTNWHTDLFYKETKERKEEMSSFKRETFNPTTEKYEEAMWIDDYFGHYNYGVDFEDGIIWKPSEIQSKEALFKKRQKRGRKKQRSSTEGTEV